MRDILNRLISDNKGPWKDYGDATRARCNEICVAVANEIIFTTVGVHPEELDGVSVEYDFSNDIWVYVTFSERATHTAGQIATAFLDLAGVAVHVRVWEAVSEHSPK